MPDPLHVTFEELCTECKQPVFLLIGDYADTFGRIYSADGLRLFNTTGRCEFCTDYLFDAAVMNREDAWWNSLPNGVDSRRDDR